MTVSKLSIIDQLFKSGNDLVEYLTNNSQLTFINEAENNFRKTLLLSSASYFEKEICDLILEFARSNSGNNDLIISIIQHKAVKRQYHTYFDWENSTNANKFFSMFGEDFKAKMAQIVRNDDHLAKSIKAFIEIGNERNKMVHQNFAEIVIDKTAKEIYDLYKLALYFIEILTQELLN